jgi:hemolysin III
MEVREYNVKEERLNVATHGLGFCASVVGTVFLLRAVSRDGGTWEFAGCLIYAVTLASTYAVSTLSHLFRSPHWRPGFRAADQAIIFLFISGTFTPIACRWLRDGLWWTLMMAMWGVAFAGFVGKALYGHRVHLGTVSTGLYLLLGWMPVVVAWHLATTASLGLVAWIVGGGLCYTLGILFFHYDARVPYLHAAWHLMVVAGSTCHYFGILFYCTQAGP